MQTGSTTTLPPAISVEDMRAHRSWFVVLAIVLIVLGLAAVAFPFIAAVAAELLLGWILVIGGIGELVHAFRLRGMNGFVMMLLCALLTLTVGVVLLLFPLSGVLSLTLLLGVLFLVAGAFRMVYAFQWRPAPSWGWLLASGILGVLLGILVLSQWPAAAAWFLGLLVGVDLAFAGACLLTLAAGSRIPA